MKRFLLLICLLCSMFLSINGVDHDSSHVLKINIIFISKDGKKTILKHVMDYCSQYPHKLSDIYDGLRRYAEKKDIGEIIITCE